MDLSFIESIVPKEHFNTDVSGTPLERAQALLNQCHPGHTHMKLLHLDGNESSAEIPLVQDTRALHGLLHGGVYYTVGDTITALMCTFHIEKPEQRMVTASGSIRYLRAVDSGNVTAKARLKRKEGDRLHFVCDFLNNEGKRAAQAKFLYALVTLPGK